MVQINLLPDVKREYLHSQQMKHTFIIGSVLLAATVLVLLALLYGYVQVLQPRHRVNLQKDIDVTVASIQDKKDGSKVVTVQGALEQLPGLQDKKLMTTRLFGYIQGFTPTGIAYNDVSLDTSINTMKLTGTSVSYERANALANNLKSAQFSYKQNDTTQTIQPFSNIVFEGLSKSEQAEVGSAVSFQISFTYNPILFDQSISDTKLVVNASSEELLLPTVQPFSNMPSTTNTPSPGGAQ